jgi:hypothetical protein
MVPSLVPPATIEEACTSRACSGSITPVPRQNSFIGTDVVFHAARNCCRADQQVDTANSPWQGKAQPALADTPTLGADLPRIARIHWFGYRHGAAAGAPERPRYRRYTTGPAAAGPASAPSWPLLPGTFRALPAGITNRAQHPGRPQVPGRPLPAQWSRPIWFDACSVLARMRRYRLVAAVLLGCSLHFSWTYLRWYGREGAGNSWDP